MPAPMPDRSGKPREAVRRGERWEVEKRSRGGRSFLKCLCLFLLVVRLDVGQTT